MKIRGVVKLANTVRQKLQNGIPQEEIQAFQELVCKNMELIEDICRQSRTTPKNLPLPSRQAYLFLKNIDLDHLPLCRRVGVPFSAKQIRINNVVKNCESISEWISTTAINQTSVLKEKKKILQKLQDEVETIEQLCTGKGASPRDMGEPSRRAYSWMKFLTLEDYFERHFETVSRGADILKKISSGCGLSSRKPFFHLVHMAGIYRRQTYSDTIILRVSEGFLDAGDEVLEAIARCALTSKDSQWFQRIEDYVDTEAYGDVLFEVETIAGLDDLESRGRHYNLGALFEKVNIDRFRREVSRPGLTWSRTFSSCKFGHYQPARDLITLSQTLDDSRVPQFVVEYVLCHELLHKKLGILRSGSTRRAHTREFRIEEKKFPRHEEAETWLTRLATDIRKGKNPWQAREGRRRL